MIKTDKFIRWNETGKRERTIAFKDGGEFIWTIDIDDPLARPIEQTTEHINDALLISKVAKIIENPFPELSAAKLDTLPQDIKEKMEKIWKAYIAAKAEILQEIADESISDKQFYDLYSDAAFIRMGKLISEKVGCQERIAQKYYRWLLQIGFKKVAVIDRRSIYSGGEGKERKSPTGRRLGAYRKTDDVENKKKKGVAVTDEVREKFEQAGLLYAGESEAEIYRKMREHLFSEEKKQSEYDEEVLVPQVESFDYIPTPRQLSFWRKKHITATDRTEARTSSRKFNKDHRAKTGKVQDYAPNCDIFAMDFTILDCYPVSSLNANQPIEKLLAGVIFGVSSSYIPAVFVGPYDESYKTVILLLRNAFLPKGDLCRRFGIKGITDDMWPGIFFSTLIYDKAPSILGKQGDELAERIAEKLGFFRIDTTASHRADLKGPVEKSHDIVRTRVLAPLPGFTPKDRERGDSEPKLKARMTAHQIYKLLLLHAYMHNFSKALENYPLTEGMITDNIIPTPHNILQWQIDNEHGDFPDVEPDDVETTLLLPGVGVITQQGIFFKNERAGKELQYTCSEAETGKWFSSAGLRGSMELEIGYDPTDTDHIILRPNSTQIHAPIRIAKPIRCDLVSNAAMEAMRGRYFVEVNAHHQNYQQKFAAHEVIEAQANATLNAHINHEIKIAEAEYKEQYDGSSNRSRISGMKERTEIERKLFEEKNKFQIFLAKPSNAPQDPKPPHSQSTQSNQNGFDISKSENKFRQAWKQEGKAKSADSE